MNSGEIINNKSGLTEDEQKVMDNLVEAWNNFIKLPKQHPQECVDFSNGIHKCQDLLAVRICRRIFPEAWPIKS